MGLSNNRLYQCIMMHSFRVLSITVESHKSNLQEGGGGGEGGQMQ